jgi:hypothetical protein
MTQASTQAPRRRAAAPRPSSWRTRPGGRDPLTRRLVRMLAEEDAVSALARRRMPLGRGTIDVLAAGPGGVTVAHVLLARASRVTIAAPEAGPGLGAPRGPRLLVGDRDHTAAVRLVERQVDAVRHALAASGGGAVPHVEGVLCLQGLGLPPLGVVALHEVRIDDGAGAVALAARPGDLSPARVERLARVLDRAFPGA